MGAVVELSVLALALLALLAIKGLRFGSFYVLLGLLFLGPLAAYALVRRYYPGESVWALGCLVAAALGLGAMLYVLLRLRRAGAPREPGTSPRAWNPSSQARPAGHGWLYRAIELPGKKPCRVEYRFVWNQDPLSPIFGEELILVDGQLVQQQLVRNWFAREHRFQLPGAEAPRQAVLELRFAWPTLRIAAVRLSVEGTVVYEENPRFWHKEDLSGKATAPSSNSPGSTSS